MKFIDVGSGHGYKHAIAFCQQVAQHLLTGKSDLGVEKTFGSFFAELQENLQQTKDSSKKNTP